MKLRILSCFCGLLVFLFGSVAQADPIFPLPEYYIISTPTGPITDIPGASVTQEGPQSWLVHPPSGHSFIMPPALVPQVVLRDPDNPAFYTAVLCSNLPYQPIRWARGEVDPLNPPTHPWWTVVDRVSFSLDQLGGPVGEVWCFDPPDAVPDSSSTVFLLTAALLGTVGASRGRLRASLNALPRSG